MGKFGGYGQCESSATSPLCYPTTSVRSWSARSLEVVELMPAGFEFGPNGAAVDRLIRDLAKLRDPACRQGTMVADVEPGRQHGRVLGTRTRPEVCRLSFERSTTPRPPRICLTDDGGVRAVGRGAGNLRRLVQ